jgi:hypothetical protein
MKPDANTTSTERSQAILVAMQEEMRRVVLGEMRPADQLAALVGRGTDEIRQDLDQQAADGRIFSVRHEGVDYFALFALNPAEGYRPYPAVGDAIRILSRVFTRENSWGLASWFLGLNSFLDDQRPADLLASDPEWVIKAAQDEVNESTYPHGSKMFDERIALYASIRVDGRLNPSSQGRSADNSRSSLA